MSRFIVTGTGRSGSRYVAALLRTLGVRCYHENVWPAVPKDEVEWGEMDGEVGWPAALYLDGFDGTIVHIVRDPVKVINSRMLSRWYEPEVSNNPRYAPVYERVVAAIGLRGLSPADQAAKHYVEWTKMIDRHTRRWLQLEQLGSGGLELLLDWLGYERPDYWRDFALKAVPKDTNRHVKQQLVDWPWIRENVSERWRAGLEQTAKFYGYRVT